MIKTTSAFTVATETLPPASRNVVHPWGPQGESIQPGVLPALATLTGVRRFPPISDGCRQLGQLCLQHCHSLAQAVWEGWSQQEAQTAGESGAAPHSGRSKPPIAAPFLLSFPCTLQ